VSASSVVEVQPGGKRGGTVGVVEEDLPVGPFDLQRAVEPLDLAVVPRAVRLDELVLGAELGNRPWQVAAFLEAAAIRLAAMESTDRSEAEPLVSGAILAGWAEWADSTRFETSRCLWEGYATAEVDTFRKELRDTFLG
jgi:hypothetical protein